jgi:ATP phosphoribosyltransferase
VTPRRADGRLVLALPKGRMLDTALGLLAAAGLDLGPPARAGRRLRLDSADGAAQALLVKPRDVLTYVEHGIADAGIAGKDLLLEFAPDALEPLDLRFGACRLVVAGPRGATAGDLDAVSSLRVATKYPAVTRWHFAARGRLVEVIELAGSVELGPVVGLSDWIVDLVETGTTLEQNGLVVVEEIARSSARLIVNRASHKTKFGRIDALVRALRREVRRP